MRILGSEAHPLSIQATPDAEIPARVKPRRLFDRFLDEAGFIVICAVAIAAVLGAPWWGLAVAIAAGTGFFLLARGRRSLFAERDSLASALSASRRELERQTNDPHTGLGTLPDLETAWTVAAARGSRHPEPFSLALVEVTAGPLANTPLSRSQAASVSDRLRDAVRIEDAIFRLDPWSFAVLLDGAGPSGAAAFIERIVCRIAGQTVHDDYVSVLAGAATWDPSYRTVLQHLRAADADLERRRQDLMQNAGRWAGSMSG